MIRLSFIIATYNRAEGIIATLGTLLDQTLPTEQWEAVVADNNSRDNTRARIEAFAQEHPQMNLVYCFEEQQGLSPARNAAIAHSKGEILVVVDDDELIDPALAKAYLDLFDARPEAAAAGGVVVPKYGIAKPDWFSPRIEELISGAFYWGGRVREFGGERYPRGGNFAIRRTMIDHYGPFNTSLGRKGNLALGGEEKELLGRLARGGQKLYYLPEAIIEHVIPDEKLTDAWFERVTRGIGVSERIRTRGSAAYFGRLFKEGVKWGGASVLAAIHTLRGAPIQGKYLLKMRWNITRGLLGLVS